jgi:hypothetical protein
MFIDVPPEEPTDDSLQPLAAEHSTPSVYGLPTVKNDQHELRRMQSKGGRDGVGAAPALGCIDC